MLMVDRRGKERSRETLSYRKYYGEEIRTVLFYKAPSNVRGTGFLIWDYPESDKEDDQWLYLPALRKVRRIPASDRGDYFLGTDFTYEDIKLDGKLSETDYEFDLLGSADLGGTPTWRLEARPKTDAIAEELGYSRNEFWVDKQTFIVLKAVFWDTRGEMLKMLEVSDIREIDGILTRHRLEMRNYKTGHRSIFLFSDVDYETPVKDSVYTRQALARGK
jgi:outer membrane lipoprotein-sorting protein